MAKKDFIMCGRCGAKLKPTQERCERCGMVHDLTKPPMEVVVECPDCGRSQCDGKSCDIFVSRPFEFAARPQEFIEGGNPDCDHEWDEQPDEPPVDTCSKCGAKRY